jgi:hypothetical protein
LALLGADRGRRAKMWGLLQLRCRGHRSSTPIVIAVILMLSVLWLLRVVPVLDLVRMLVTVAIVFGEGPSLADAPVGCLQLDRSQEGLVGTVQELQAGNDARRVSTAKVSSICCATVVPATGWQSTSMLALRRT